jgi:ABC-type multidrug transport system ATPase subunit
MTTATRDAGSGTMPLQARDLAVDFGRRKALGPFTFAVGRAETVALTGTNGSGKTTALRLALGLVRASAGTSQVFGRAVSPLAPPLDVGYVPDKPVFYDWDSAAGNLALLEPDRGRIDEALRVVGLGDVAAQPVKGFSRGMRQRLSLARALVREPKLLVMDEPTIALDTGGVEMLLEVLAARRQDGLATLVATHDRDFLAAIDARKIAVEAGRTQ